MPDAATEPKPPAKGNAVVWLLAVIVPVLLLLAWWPSGKPKARPALPNPNGYDYFVQAGGAMAGMWTNASPHALSATELQAYLLANHANLALVREGLRHQSHTHLDYDATYIDRVQTNMSTAKRMGVLLWGEGWLAELEGKPSAALESYIAGMRLGQECSRGGVMMERLVGISIENFSLTALRSLLPKLDAATARRAQEHLLRLDATHDAASVNLAAEDEWITGAFPLGQRVMTRVHPVLRKAMRDTRDPFEQTERTLQATRRRAIVETAARLFELEQGRRPTGYADLVPAYLPAAPHDPTTGKAIAHPF